mgnify:CR=1 FL=1
MEKIGHVRIDDRLIHGQIVASWINVLRCSTIIVADDKAAKDELQKMMLEMACPPNIKLLTSGGLDRSKVLLIMRNSASALRLMEKDVGIDKINVGNVSSGSGRKKYTKSVWLNEQDIAEYKALRDRGIELEIQIVPSEKAQNMADMLK